MNTIKVEIVFKTYGSRKVAFENMAVVTHKAKDKEARSRRLDEKQRLGRH